MRGEGGEGGKSVMLRGGEGGVRGAVRELGGGGAALEGGGKLRRWRGRGGAVAAGGCCGGHRGRLSWRPGVRRVVVQDTPPPVGLPCLPHFNPEPTP